MPSLGPLKILVVFVVALLVFGPDKLPEIARQVGRAASEFRRFQDHIRTEINDVVGDLDPRRPGDPVPTLPALSDEVPAEPEVAEPGLDPQPQAVESEPESKPESEPEPDPTPPPDAA